jgi:hypothetical protein
MEIIIPPKQYSQGDIGKAFEREVRTGLELKKATEEKRELQARAQAKQFRDMKRVKGLGKCVAVIPPWEFFRLKQKYGKEVHSNEFLQYFQKKHPELAPNRI